ncbi:MAG: D-alanyl-D-alanine carboxypeptidase [Clostridia bacterium]|nr:D-alanyl-D-alanine carboxypeptidase [Clostridia bacterium]
MIKRITAFVLALLTVAFLSVNAFAEESVAEEEEPVTENILVIKNLNSGNNLNIKSAPSRSFQAGVAARLMTALVAYECLESKSVKISVPFCASDAALRGSGSYIGFKYSEANDALTAEDLLSAALVSSATDACLSLAVAAMRHKAGESTDYSHDYASAASASTKERGHLNDFVALMNQRASELGCTGTNFTNCTGVSDPQSKTTAEDIAIIAAAICENSELYAISDKASYYLSTGSNQIYTKNALKSSYNLKGYTLENVKGMTVGYLQGPDNYCVVTTAESGGLSYVFVCVNTTATGSAPTEDGSKSYAAEISAYKTIHAFLPWAVKAFRYLTVVSPFTAVATVPVKAGKGQDSVTIVPKEKIELLVTKDIDPEKDISVVYTDISGLSLSAPVVEGQEVGTVYVYLKGEQVGQTALVTNDGVAESAALSMVDKVKNALTSDYMVKIYKWAFYLLIAYMVIVFGMFVYRIVRKYIAAGRD